jgi:hypothetical protein
MKYVGAARKDFGDVITGEKGNYVRSPAQTD